jgi:hypothetical protein
MATQEQHESFKSPKAAGWWLALMGILLFSITVAPDYPPHQVVFGLFIVMAIHLLVAILRRGQAANAGLTVHSPRPSNARILMFLLPIAVVGVVGILAGGTSVWHVYFCALAIGSFTAMCWIYPSRAKKQDKTVAPKSSRI